MDKNDLLEKMKQQLDELNQLWNTERAKFESKAQNVSAEARKTFATQSEELRKLRLTLKEKIIDLEVASENAWNEVKDGAEDAWTTMRSAIKKAMEHFK